MPGPEVKPHAARELQPNLKRNINTANHSLDESQFINKRRPQVKTPNTSDIERDYKEFMKMHGTNKNRASQLNLPGRKADTATANQAESMETDGEYSSQQQNEQNTNSQDKRWIEPKKQ
ncbi:hypothetical protein QAD02_014513 [Eretmocerus hayati]|uniref:Uncharacterized protein n=1 Tax=Eretmocerus hayati TaxID=131215 RepID=A0ACC2P5K7_9HYME|nr:hypothetical protein QAD02_014513 [Eretmocerus hayati]